MRSLQEYSSYLSCLSNFRCLNPEYDQFSQNVSGGVKEAELTLDYLRTKFAIEDTRKSNLSTITTTTTTPTTQANNTTTLKPAKSTQSTTTTTPRKCSKCSTLLPKITPKNHKMCVKCFNDKKNNQQQQQQQQQTLQQARST